jgi:hypothetical protein
MAKFETANEDSRLEPALDLAMHKHKSLSLDSLGRGWASDDNIETGTLAGSMGVGRLNPYVPTNVPDLTWDLATG